MECTKTQPKDIHKLAYILHFFLGAGNLLPWNAFITAADYYNYLYPNKHVEKVFSVTYMTSSLLVLVLMLSCKKNMISLRMRMNVGFSMFILSLMVTPMMQWGCNKNVNGEDKMRSSVAYSVVVVSVLICGLCDGLIGGSLIGTAGMLPKEYMQAIFAGTASSGVLISVLRIVTKASLPQTPDGLKTSAQFYFIASSAILIICIICCNLLYKLPVMQEHYKNHQTTLPINNNLSTPNLIKTFTKIKFPCFGIFIIYTVTLSIFPGFLAENIKSELLKDWYPVTLIATYNVSDFVGKSLTGVYVMKSVKKATWGCFVRVLFYPMFFGCFRGPKWSRTEVPVVLLTVMLGLSNGYLTSVVMILAPKAVPPSEAEVAAIVMVVMLGMGLVAGCWFCDGVVLDHLMEPS